MGRKNKKNKKTEDTSETIAKEEKKIEVSEQPSDSLVENKILTQDDAPKKTEDLKIEDTPQEDNKNNENDEHKVQETSESTEKGLNQTSEPLNTEEFKVKTEPQDDTTIKSVKSDGPDLVPQKEVHKENITEHKSEKNEEKLNEIGADDKAMEKKNTVENDESEKHKASETKEKSEVKEEHKELHREDTKAAHTENNTKPVPEAKKDNYKSEESVSRPAENSEIVDKSSEKPLEIQHSDLVSSKIIDKNTEIKEAEENKGNKGKTDLDDMSTEFSISYKTEFGENLLIVGSIPELGNWDPNNGLKLEWEESHTWRGKVSYSSLPFEYKYICKSDSNILWESGPNRTVEKNLGSISDSWNS